MSKYTIESRFDRLVVIRSTHGAGFSIVCGSQYDAHQFRDLKQANDLFKHLTNLSAFGFTLFYIYAMKSGFNPENVFASIPAVIHVFAAIGISLSMFQLQGNSLMRVVHVLGLLLLANLG